MSRGDGYIRGVSMSSGEGEYVQGVGVDNHLTPLVLTPSGDHQNTQGWQANSTHPTGMPKKFTDFSNF